MRILYVTVDKGWAVQHRCDNLKREFEKEGHNILVLTREEMKEKFDYYVEQYDIIHFQYSGSLTMFYEQFKKYPNRFYTTVISHRSIEGSWDDVGKLNEILSLSKGIICLSHKLYGEVHKRVNPECASKMYCVPNGIDETLFKPLRDYKVGFIGRRDEHKGYDLIKQACCELGVELIDDGNEYPDKIKKHKDMPSVYRKFDCLAIASLSEGCHNPTLEALSMNIPVVSTDVGIANRLAGVIIVDRDVEDIKRGIEIAIPRLAILKNYTWAKIAQKLKTIYEKS